MLISTNSQKPNSINFGKITIDQLLLGFGLVENANHNFPLKSFETSNLELAKITELATLSKNQAMYWNEQELIVNLIGPTLSLVNISGNNYKTFFERIISEEVQGVKMTGTVDMMVAFGIHSPIKPYFFIQEFKKSLNQSGDPLAQLLGEMMVAQKINNEERVLGCYIIGQYWRFVVLHQNEFTQTKSFDSNEIPNFEIIVNHLKSVKIYIEEKLAKK